jgi:Tfp pilus assembly protein PilN
MSHASNFDGSLFETPEAAAEYDRKQSLRLANAEMAKFDNLSSEQIRSLYEIGLKDHEQRAGEIRSQRAGEVFVASHPEYVLCPENAAQVQNYLELKGCSESNVRVEDLESAYEHLSQRGLLKINQAKAREQQQNEINEEAQEIRRRRSSSSISSRVRSISRERPSFSEEDLYSMSLDKLRAIALAASEDE